MRVCAVSLTLEAAAQSVGASPAWSVRYVIRHFALADVFIDVSIAYALVITIEMVPAAGDSRKILHWAEGLGPKS